MQQTSPDVSIVNCIAVVKKIAASWLDETAVFSYNKQIC
jgi:hypothetical protein